MLTDLVSALMAALGQNTANSTPAILSGIPFVNAEGEEAQLPQEGGDATVSGVQTDTSACRRDSVFNKIEQSVTDPNLDDDYDSEYEHFVGSRGCADLLA